MGCEDTAVAGNQAKLMFGYLSAPAIATNLHDRLANRGHSPHIEGAELAAAGVDRNRAAGADRAGGDEWAAFAFFAEAVILEGDENRKCVAIVDFAKINGA